MADACSPPSEPPFSAIFKECEVNFVSDVLFDDGEPLGQKATWGCACGDEKCQEDVTCPCHNSMYDEHGRLSAKYLELVKQEAEHVPPLIECGDMCSCAMSCVNRAVQQPVPFLSIVPQGKKGLGVVTTAELPAGTFCGIYCGQLVSSDALPESDYIYTAFEHSGAKRLRIAVDARHCGNHTRFFNHACNGGNMISTLVRVGSTPVPYIAFFTNCKVDAFSELCFDYAGGSVAENGITPCQCGAPNCRGWLPRVL